MFFPMRSGLQARLVNQHIPLSDAICDAQNRIRHAGRKIGRRSIGSTLLVKGLEFDHAVIIHASNMTRKDWYVALTRATTSLTILSPCEYIIPK
jgi:DNA helicase IV